MKNFLSCLLKSIFCILRKYNVGKFFFLCKCEFLGYIVDARWIFGCIELNTNKCFMVTVPDRTIEVPLPIIQKYLLPVTTIISDGWAAYRRISELSEGYTHQVVNHLENFVDSEGATTNHIESEWQKFKMENKKRYDTDRRMLF
jgi:hypothetical protein